jgi:hypothetical protein
MFKLSYVDKFETKVLLSLSLSLSLSLFLCLIVVYYIPQKVTFGPNIMFALYLIFVFRQKLYFQAR